MLKQLALATAAASLVACGGAEPVDPSTGAVGKWYCKVSTLKDGKAHRQVFEMELGEDRSAKLTSRRDYKDDGISFVYTQTTVGKWKTGGMRFGFDNLTHDIEVVSVGGKIMRGKSETQRTPFARQLLRDKLKPIEELIYDIELIDKDRFRLVEGLEKDENGQIIEVAEGEDDGGIRTNCRIIKELTPEQIAEAEAKAAEKAAGPQNTKSGLFD